jgi:photosystem II stability/assembly factor-like uncharacterized protein
MSVTRKTPLPAILLAMLAVSWPVLRVHGSQEALQKVAAAQSVPVLSLAVDASDGSLLKVGGGLFRSADRGATWHRLPIPAALRAGTIRQVATTGAAPASIWAAGPGAGVLRSDDGGRTWRSAGAGLPSQDVTAVAVHSFRPDTLYASITRRGVFRTEDGGGRWQKMDDGPPAPVVELAHSTLEGSMNTGWLYAATPGGPYLSMDCF